MLGVVELIARRLIDRHGSAASSGIGRLSSVKLLGTKAELMFLVTHFTLSLSTASTARLIATLSRSSIALARIWL